MDDYFKSAIVYYFKYLIDNGYKDPVKVIISDFIDTIKLTDEQKKYLYSKNNINNNEIIDNILVLIKKMKMDKKLDIDSLELIENNLKHLM